MTAGSGHPEDRRHRVDVSIAQVRSTFGGNRGVITATLTPRPSAMWQEYCTTYLARYHAAFGGSPTLLDDAIVVSIEGASGLRQLEDALCKVVDAANRAVAEEEWQSPPVGPSDVVHG